MSLEQIAREIAPAPDPYHPQQFSKWRGKNHLFTQKFGEVAKSFLEGGKVGEVCARAGISPYILRKHFFSNPEFCALLKGANEAIFREVTQPYVERNESFLAKASQLAGEALDEMERLLHESENEHIVFRVAQDLLDRDPEGRASRTRRVEGPPSVKIDLKFLQIAAQAAKETEE